MGCLPDSRRQAGTYTHKDSSLSLEGGGLARKAVSYDPKTALFWVDEYVTGYQDEYTLDELRSDTNILKAMEAGALYLDD
ncbi:MAG: hypothetical protein JRJ13_14085 [Deltaproteobacteria bacterium]|nr:hypothetical protein [Deltaproteobacteria bacterium]